MGHVEVRQKIYQSLETGEISMGTAVRDLRKAMKLTQAKYAKAIGIDIRVLSAFERGQGNLRLDTVKKILTPLGLALTARWVDQDRG